ncbi:glycosyltransferase family 4 protein [Marinomonas ostreistagni]|uniref:Glycosyltransferase family 4 protein n=1 Tax=Marinomonas ostreistagni TaxID=359209 RepID=A0ABS0ZCW3_9GAMM|nr:glycosyltransferase family 4 protein [Marinomonas ostreistagni]MBJ7551506.1 glycosyltransferase family 4 protein [Marinomonas ostreistagni]
MIPTIYFHQEAYSTSGPKLMGRNAAGESFLRAVFQYASAEEIWAYVDQSHQAKSFFAEGQRLAPHKQYRALTTDRFGLLERAGMLYLPGPNLSASAWQRNVLGANLWSLVGITHTVCTKGAMDEITELISSPVQPWDALICTSHSVKKNVLNILQSQMQFFSERFGAKQFPLPQLPVIPLGIHCQDFNFSDQVVVNSRSILGLDKNDVAVLFVGRLSFHSKAHPLAMYQALELAQQTTAKNIVLLELGSYASEHIKKAFEEAFMAAAPSVRRIVLDGVKKENFTLAWSSADLFCSLADNIQESFGITPIEAMAAGLPAIVSDWDGYKESVIDGETGYCIPSIQPCPGLGKDLAIKHALGVDSYDRYIGYTSSLVAIDIDQTAAAIRLLADHPEQRKKMGEAGRKRALDVYDWSVIIPQYEALWGELECIRKNCTAQNQTIWPARLDPFEAFSHYPSQVLDGATMLILRDPKALRFRDLSMVNFAESVTLSTKEADAIAYCLQSEPKSAQEVVAHFAKNEQPRILRGIANLLKLGVLAVA